MNTWDVFFSCCRRSFRTPTISIVAENYRQGYRMYIYRIPATENMDGHVKRVCSDIQFHPISEAVGAFFSLSEIMDKSAKLADAVGFTETIRGTLGASYSSSEDANIRGPLIRNPYCRHAYQNGSERIPSKPGAPKSPK